MTKINNIDCLTLKEWMDKGDAVLIDVREDIEYKNCSIPNSYHLPLSQVSIDVTHLPKHKNKKIVIHCKSGKRSMMACQKLIEDGIKFEIWNLEGGIDAWKASNLSTCTALKKIPISRQVNLVIGILILVSLVLFSTSSIKAYLLIALVCSIGLIFSGLTGFCLLTKIISKLPWNK